MWGFYHNKKPDWDVSLPSTSRPYQWSTADRMPLVMLPFSSHYTPFLRVGRDQTRPPGVLISVSPDFIVNFHLFFEPNFWTLCLIIHNSQTQRGWVSGFYITLGQKWCSSTEEINLVSVSIRAWMLSVASGAVGSALCTSMQQLTCDMKLHHISPFCFLYVNPQAKHWKNELQLPKIKLYCASCAFRIFLFSVQLSSKSTSAMKPSSKHSLDT